MTTITNQYKSGALAVFMGFCRRSAILLIFSFAVSSVALLSCTEEPRSQEEHLVVEAYIDSDGFPYVMLTTNLMPTTKPQLLVDHLIRWGKVTISDGVDTVIMTGAANYDIFPPFWYRTFDMRGKPGCIYEIWAEYKNMCVYARAEVPSAPSILGYNVKTVEGADSTCSVSVSFRQDDGEGLGYYVAFVKVGSRRSIYLPAFLGNVAVSDKKRETELAIFQPKSSAYVPQFNPNFHTGDTISIMISQVDAMAYDFWSKYQEQVNFSHSIFTSSTVSLPSNLTGGYGYFTARGSSILNIILDDPTANL